VPKAQTACPLQPPLEPGRVFLITLAACATPDNPLTVDSAYRTLVAMGWQGQVNQLFTSYKSLVSQGYLASQRACPVSGKPGYPPLVYRVTPEGKKALKAAHDYYQRMLAQLAPHVAAP
jgi:hypothetical protein